MGIDINKIRAKVAEEAAKSRKNFDVVRRLKLKTGENRLRLMPPWTTEGINANQFWTETYTHWNIGEGGYSEDNGRRFTCPLKTPGAPAGSTCEVCELNARLKASDDPADQEIGKQIYARRQFNSNVVNLKDPVIKQADIDEWLEAKGDTNEECPFELGDTKVQIWSYPAAIYTNILDIFADELDLSDLENGHDLIVTKEGTGLTTKYRVRMAPKASAFEFIGDLEKSLYNLDNLIRFPEPGDMQKALNGELVKSAPSLPAPEAKKIPQLPPKKTAKPAPVVEEVEEEEVEEETPEEVEKPECYADPKVHSSTDVQCVGGTDEDGNEYDACPVYDECAAEVAALVAPPTRRKPAPAKTAPKAETKPKSAVDAMEAKLRAALKG